MSQVRVLPGEPLNELRRETSVIWLTEKIYYHSSKRRRKIGIGIRPEKPQKIKTNPILQALRFQELLNSKEVKSRNELAKKLGLSRVRMTQIMNLLKFNPEINSGQNLPLYCDALRIAPDFGLAWPKIWSQQILRMQPQPLKEL